MKTLRLMLGDCTERMKELQESSIDAIVCDPPYGIFFMGRVFDDLGKGQAQADWHKAWLEQAYRVLKPGAQIWAFGGSRTYHWLARAMRQVGFAELTVKEYCYGSGFPKSLNVSKALKKMKAKGNLMGLTEAEFDAKIAQYEGYGSALKPAHEPLVCGKKPLGV